MIERGRTERQLERAAAATDPTGVRLSLNIPDDGPAWQPSLQGVDGSEASSVVADTLPAPTAFAQVRHRNGPIVSPSSSQHR